MIFQLSKKVNDNQFINEFELSKRYDVFDGNELMGQFFYSSKKCFFTFDKRRIKLDIRKSFFTLPKVSVIEEKTGETIGKYSLTNPGIFRGFSDCISIHHEVHNFKRLRPDLRHSIFKKETWGQFKFGLSNDVEEIIYSFRIDFPAISLGNTAPERPFEGSIYFSSSNKLLLLAGLYLVERALENCDD